MIKLYINFSCKVVTYKQSNEPKFPIEFGIVPVN